MIKHNEIQAYVSFLPQMSAADQISTFLDFQGIDQSRVIALCRKASPVIATRLYNALVTLDDPLFDENGLLVLSEEDAVDVDTYMAEMMGLDDLPAETDDYPAPEVDVDRWLDSLED